MAAKSISLSLLLTALFSMQVRADDPPAPLPFTLAKETTAITAPLRDDGAPDYRAAIDARFGKEIMPQNNAALLFLQLVDTDRLDPLYRTEFLKALGAPAETPEKGAFISYGAYLIKQGINTRSAAVRANDELRKDAACNLWSAADHPDLADYLKAQEANLALASRAAQLDHWYSPITPHAFISGGSPLLSGINEITYALCARATLRAKTGDFDSFLADMLTVKKIARLVASRENMQGFFSARAIENQASGLLAAAAGSGILSAGQCAQVRQSLAAFSEMPNVADAIDTLERWGSLETAQALARAKNGRIPRDPAVLLEDDPLMTAMDVSLVDWDLVLKSINQQYDGVVKAINVPDYALAKRATEDVKDKFKAMQNQWQARDELLAITHTPGMLWLKDPDETKVAYSQRIAGGLMTITAGVESDYLAMADELQRAMKLESDMANAILAAAQYKADKGTWPKKLGDLVPIYLKKIPLDIFADDPSQEVQYDLSGEVIHLSSVGTKITKNISLAGTESRAPIQDHPALP